jgi:hypothetical protein
MKNIILILISIISIFIISSCEDEAPGAYIPDNVLEALLVVDEPIQNILLIRTQPIFDKFIYDSSLIRNAVVKINGDNREFIVKFRSKEYSLQGYYFEDTTYTVKSGIKYNIDITLNDGTKLTGETMTPPRTEWEKNPKPFLQFPKDSLKLPPTDTIAWKKQNGFDFYIILVKCLDTLNYGKYLIPATDEMNRRIERPFRNDRAYRETATLMPIPNTQTPVVWNTFKWFGLHEVGVFVPDWNFLRWYIQSQTRSQIDPLLTSIKGGYGYFGSASVIRDTSVIIKNQP